MATPDPYGAYLSQGASEHTAEGALSGMTVAVKDALMTADERPTTAASQILEPFVSPYDATVIKKLRASGAELLGKTNLDEFAMGSSTENSALGKTVNPWDKVRVPGGSSGGSAVAVAAAEARLGIGSDTGGSVRQPAAFCGVVGLKPTYGRVSRHGLIAMASSLDQIGTFSKTVADSALLLREIAGPDADGFKDATCADQPVPDYVESLEQDLSGLRIGLPKEYFIEGVEPAVAEAIQRVADDFSAHGADVGEISLPYTEYAVPVYYIVMPAEGSSNLARYDGIRYGYSAETDPAVELHSLEDVYLDTRERGFGPEVQRRIMLGTYVLSSGYYDAYFKKATEVRTLITQDFEQAFQQVDLILTPTTPTTAFRLGEKTADPLRMYLNDIFTVPANLAGIPGISIPCGFDQHNLPIGAQLLAPHWGEERLLAAAHAYEQRHHWYEQWPPTVKGAHG